MIAGALWLAGCGALSEPDRDWPDASPAMWEITAPSGEVGWIFGTVHALPDDVDWHTPLLDEKFAQAGVLVVEVANLDDPAGASLYADLSETPGQPALTRRVDPDERDALRQLLDDAGMEDDDFSRIESWAAAMMLSGKVRTGDPTNGVDRALIDEADTVVGLETYVEQLTMFDTLSSEAQSDLLFGVARSHQADSGDGMLLAWIAGQEDELAGHVNDTLQLSPELRRVLLTDRNERWTPRIAAKIEGGRKPFVAVGAGHVIGEDGLVALLEQRSFAARRIQ
ncbi:TraB/GumN family protein [Aurantiacibacter rhizosphaerae]|nr:TraB/GumN family protein [Aurantiacibacter rhizosphaerae]